MLEKIVEIIANQLSIDKDQIKSESTMSDDFGADSLDIVEIIMAIEDETGVNIPDEAIVDIKTVGELVSYVEAHS